MAKQVRDMNVGRLKGVTKTKTASADTGNGTPPNGQKTVQLDLANAPLYQAKFLEGILIEFRKYNVMFGDVVKMLREKNG